MGIISPEGIPMKVTCVSKSVSGLSLSILKHRQHERLSCLDGNGIHGQK